MGMMPNKPLLLHNHTDLNARAYDVKAVQKMNELHVTWDHDYYLCRSFNVSLNGTVVPECTRLRATLSCITTSFQPGMRYNIKVIAIESDAMPMDSQNLFINTVPLDPYKGMC